MWGMPYHSAQCYVAKLIKAGRWVSSRTGGWLAFAEFSTGEVRLMEMSGRDGLVDELARVSPSEVLISDQQTGQFGRFARALA